LVYSVVGLLTLYMCIFTRGVVLILILEFLWLILELLGLLVTENISKFADGTPLVRLNPLSMLFLFFFSCL